MPSENINVLRRDENPDTLIYNSTGFDQFHPPHTSTATETENLNQSPPQALPPMELVSFNVFFLN